MAGKNTAVYGIYANRGLAENAVDRLLAQGFRNEDISVMLQDNVGTKDFAHEKHTKAPEGTAAGAAAGATVGGTLGLLAGVGALAIPGLGPFIAAGPIMATLAGMGSGGLVGGVVGALVGSWLMDRLGRRVMFLGTMVMFIVFALAQAFAPNMESLAVIRLLLGIPLGADIAVGYTYIMESMPAGKREAMGNRWQAMFAIGEVAAILVVTAMFVAGVAPDLMWWVALGAGVVLASVLLMLRFGVPETVIWVIQKGRFREAKAVARSTYGEPRRRGLRSLRYHSAGCWSLQFSTAEREAHQPGGATQRCSMTGCVRVRRMVGDGRRLQRHTSRRIAITCSPARLLLAILTLSRPSMGGCGGSSTSTAGRPGTTCFRIVPLVMSPFSPREIRSGNCSVTSVCVTAGMSHGFCSGSTGDSRADSRGAKSWRSGHN